MRVSTGPQNSSFRRRQNTKHEDTSQRHCLKTVTAGFQLAAKQAFPLLSPRFCLPNSCTASALCIIFEFEG